MGLIRTLRSRFSALFKKRKLDADMDEEMRLHLELLTERNLEAGMSPEEARYTAQRKFGGVEQIKERGRDERGFLWLDQLGQDLRYGWKQLRRNPGFTATVVATFALGIGAVTVVFSIVNSVILKPLSYAQPERLYVLHESIEQDTRVLPVSWKSFYDWQERATCFSELTAYSFVSGTITGMGEPERVAMLEVSPGYFTTFGIGLLAGRGFLPDEATPGHGNVAVISHRYWQTKFSGRPDIINQTVLLNDRAYTIVGIMPASEPRDRAPNFYVPAAVSAENRESRVPKMEVVARLAPGISLKQAKSEMEVLSHALNEQYPAKNQHRGVRFTALMDYVLETSAYLMTGIRPLLFTLLGAVSCLLLIACTNIANLLFSRASTRRKELAVRMALGATRGRIVRQLLAESLLLALIGGTLGVLLAYWGLDLLKSLTNNLPRSSEIAMDGHSLAFSFLTVLITGVGFGVLPAWQASQVKRNEALNGGHHDTSAPRTQRARKILMSVEIAMALTLLSGAGLLIHSYVRLQKVDLGFEAEHVLGSRIELLTERYKTPQQQAVFIQQVIERAAHLPGVESVAFTTGMPIFGSYGTGLTIEGSADGGNQSVQPASHAVISASYFRTIGVALIYGREFGDTEWSGSSQAVIISESAAKRYFPNENPIGRRIYVQRSKQWREIVGVVTDVKQWGPAGRTADFVYEPLGQSLVTYNLMIVARTTSRGVDAPAALRSVLQSIDPNIALKGMSPLSEGVAASIAKYRLSTTLFLIFSFVALLLTIVGVYGVIAYAVTCRTREFGVRLALGATGGAVIGLVLRQYAGPILVGLALGTAASGALSRFLGSLLFSVSPTDPITLGAVSLFLIVVAVIACWLPARRAAKVDPMVALRAE